VLNTEVTGYLLQKLLTAHGYTDTQSRAVCSTWTIIVVGYYTVSQKCHYFVLL